MVKKGQVDQSVGRAKGGSDVGQFSSNVIRLRAEPRKLSGKATRVAMIGPTCRMRPHIVRAFESQSCSSMQRRSLEQKERNNLPGFCNKRSTQAAFGLKNLVSKLAVTHRPDPRYRYGYSFGKLIMALVNRLVPGKQMAPAARWSSSAETH